MKKIIQYISSIFSKKDHKEKEENNKDPLLKDNSYMDIVVSLDKNFNINVFVYMKDKKIESISEKETIIVYHEFLNSCFTENAQKIILDIIDKDIKNDEIENIVDNLNKLLLYKLYAFDDKTTYIKPSEVFSKYIPRQ